MRDTRYRADFGHAQGIIAATGRGLTGELLQLPRVQGTHALDDQAPYAVNEGAALALS